MAHFLVRVSVVTLVAAGASWGACAACVRWWPLLLPSAAGKALPGLRVDGAPLRSDESVRLQVEARARAWQGRSVRLVIREGGAVRTVVETTLGDFGLTIDTDAITAIALRLGRSQDMQTRARLAERARSGSLDVPFLPGVDPLIAFERLLPLKEQFDVPSVAARLDVEHHSGVAEREGRALDIDEAIARLARAAMDATTTEVELPFVAVAPHVTSASLAKIDVSKVLSAFATYFSRRGDQAPRALNIEAAAQHIDGLIIGPGEIVSFNDVVGARSGDNGFQKAFEIYKGEMVEGTGGGTCQVASTLHAAAFFGGLDIVQRLPHSRPSAYIPAGLDATVVYPVVDLKLRNPYAFPLVVHAAVDPNRVTILLLGAEKVARVALLRTVLTTTPFDRKVVEDPSISTPKRKQKGLDGMLLQRKRIVSLRGAPNRVETSRDTYPPTTEIWKIPPGYDEADLPPLGEDFPDPDHPDASPSPPRVGDPEQTIWGG